VSEGVCPTATLDLTRFTPSIFSLLLGGGYGFLTGEHGLALDNLVKVCPIINYSVLCLTTALRLLWLQLVGRS